MKYLSVVEKMKAEAVYNMSRYFLWGRKRNAFCKNILWAYSTLFNDTKEEIIHLLSQILT
jgi:hypothetical protein